MVIKPFQQEILDAVKNNPNQPFYKPRAMGASNLRRLYMLKDLAEVVGHEKNVDFLFHFWTKDHVLDNSIRNLCRHRFQDRTIKYGPLNLVTLVDGNSATELRKRANRNLAEGNFIDALNLTMLAEFIKEYT